MRCVLCHERLSRRRGSASTADEIKELSCKTAFFPPISHPFFPALPQLPNLPLTAVPRKGKSLCTHHTHVPSCLSPLLPDRRKRRKRVHGEAPRQSSTPVTAVARAIVRQARFVWCLARGLLIAGAEGVRHVRPVCAWASQCDVPDGGGYTQPAPSTCAPNTCTRQPKDVPITAPEQGGIVQVQRNVGCNKDSDKG
jgi:hypothetical protein